MSHTVGDRFSSDIPIFVEVGEGKEARQEEVRQDSLFIDYLLLGGLLDFFLTCISPLLDQKDKIILSLTCKFFKNLMEDDVPNFLKIEAIWKATQAIPTIYGIYSTIRSIDEMRIAQVSPLQVIARRKEKFYKILPPEGERALIKQAEEARKEDEAEIDPAALLLTSSINEYYFTSEGDSIYTEENVPCLMHCKIGAYAKTYILFAKPLGLPKTEPYDAVYIYAIKREGDVLRLFAPKGIYSLHFNQNLLLKAYKITLPQALIGSKIDPDSFIESVKGKYYFDCIEDNGERTNQCLEIGKRKKGKPKDAGTLYKSSIACLGAQNMGEKFISVSFQDYNALILNGTGLFDVTFGYDSNIVVASRYFDLQPMLQGKKIDRFIGKFEAYYLFEISDDENNKECVMLHRNRLESENLLPLMFETEEKQRVTQAAACGDLLFVHSPNAWPKMRIFSPRPAHILIKPYIQELQNLTVSEWCDRFKERYEKERDECSPAVQKFMDFLLRDTKAKAIDTLTDYEGTPAEILAITDYLRAKGIQPPEWKLDFETTSIFEDFPKWQTKHLASIKGFYPFDNRMMLIHAKKQKKHGGVESISFFDIGTRKHIAIQLNDKSSDNKEYTPLRRDIREICGQGLEVKISDGYVFVSASSALSYITPDGTRFSFEHQELIFHPNYQINLSSDIRARIGELPPETRLDCNYKIVDFKAAIKPDDVKIHVLIRDGGGEGQKYEVFTFSNLVEKKSPPPDTKQAQNISFGIEHKVRPLLLLLRTQKLEQGGNQPQTIQKEVKPEENIKNLTQLERSLRLRNFAIASTIASIALIVFTAIAVAPLAILQPGSAVIIYGCAFNISLVSTAAGGSCAAFLVFAISAVLWIVDLKKARNHRKIQHDYDKDLKET